MGAFRIPAFDGRTFTKLFLIALTVGLAVSYAHSFNIGFYFDDGYGIQNNPAIRSLWNIPSFFTDPFTLTSLRQNVDIRPVLVTTYAINYAISGNAPWSYHALNLIIHFLTAVMVFVLVRDHLWWPISRRGQEGSARYPAAAAALFFALAPINNQALNYMWARSALLCTALYIAAFLAILNRRLLLAIVLHALALLTKAIALTLPAVFVIYDFLYRDRERHPDFRTWIADWRELVPPVAPLLALDLVYLVLRAVMLPPWAADVIHERWVTPWIWFISQLPAMLHYVRIFVWPSGLSVDHDFPYTLSFWDPAALGSALLLVAWVAAALQISKRFPYVAFATLWFFVTLAPESSFSPLAEVVNDHRPYIASSLGLSVLLAWLVEQASIRTRRREVFVGIVLLLCAGACVVGNRRTSQWASEESLWNATVASSPNNGRAWMNAGLIDFHKGDYKEARRRFDKARQLLPAYGYVYMNLSALELAENHPKEALEMARQAVRFRPDVSTSYIHLGASLERNGNLAEAVAAYRQAAELDPNDAPARTNYERTLAALGNADTNTKEAAMMSEGLRLMDADHDYERAVTQFRALLAQHPDHYGATYQLARSLDAAGRPGEALPLWQKMLTMAQDARDTQTEARVRERLARPPS